MANWTVTVTSQALDAQRLVGANGDVPGAVKAALVDLLGLMHATGPMRVETKGHVEDGVGYATISVSTLLTKHESA